MAAERKAVIVKFPLDELEAIEVARGPQDRSSWIRAKLRAVVALEKMPLISATTAERVEQEHDTIRRW